MSLQTGSICRLCMSQTSAMLPLFGENCTLPNRIMVLVPVLKLSVGDGLPAQVCQQCVHQVNNSYNFKLQCESSDYTLRQYLSTEESRTQSYWTSSTVDHSSRNFKKETASQLTISCVGDSNCQEFEGCNTRGKKFSSHMKSFQNIQQRGNKHQDDSSVDRSSANYKDSDTIGSLIRDMLPCNICGKTFPRKSKLKEHIKRHVGGRTHVCEVCGKRFTERSSLKKHAVFHTGQKAHVCDVCGKRFTLLAHLKTHTLIHTGQKSHVCDVCGKRFSQLGNFRTHALLHTGEKPFSCNLCGKSFAQKNTLKIHIAAHSGQKPYICDICGRSFSQPAHLKTHAIVHSGRKQYSCDVCGTSFTRKHNLKKHAARHSSH